MSTGYGKKIAWSVERRVIGTTCVIGASPVIGPSGVIYSVSPYCVERQ